MAVVTSRAPLAPSGWPSAIAPPFGLTCESVVGQAVIARHRQRLRGEGLVQFDDVDVGESQPGLGEHLAHGRRGTEAHDARRDAGNGGGDDARARRQAMALRGIGRGDQHRARAVVHAGGIAGGDAAVGLDDALQLGERLERGLARMLVPRDDGRIALSSTGSVTGTISSAMRPAAIAASARCWLRSAKAS